MLLNNEWVNNDISKEIKKFLEKNANEPTTVQNLWNIAKAVLRGQIIVIQAYLKKIETFQINNLTLHLTRMGGTTINKAQREWKEGSNQNQNRIK